MSKHKFSNWIAARIEDNDWASIETYFNDTPFAQHMALDVRLDDPSRPKCMLRENQPFHTGGVGQDFVNGAVIAAIFDFVVGLTALPHASEGNFATTNVNVKFIKPVEQDGLYAVAECTRQIGQKLFVESTLYNGQGDPCCFANGEVRVGIN